MKSAVQVRGDGVDLAHVTDAEGCDHAEDAEQYSQNGADLFTSRFRSQTVPEIIHGSSGPFAMHVLAAIVDTEDILRVVGHHSKEGHDPHPKNRSRTAGYDGGRHAGDIAGTDGGCKGSAQALELADLFVMLFGVFRDMFVRENPADCVFDPVFEVCDLEHFGEKSHQDAGADQKDQHGKSPDESVYGIVDVFYGACDLIHTFPPIYSKITLTL